MQIPIEKLRQGRDAALTKIKKQRRRQKQLTTLVTTFVLILCFIVSIRVSSSIASYAAKIPGLNVIVEAIQDNEGIKDAINNDYFEEIGLMESKNGKTITLQGAMIDEYNIMLAYDMDYPTPVQNHHNYDVQILQNGKELIGAITWGTPNDREEDIVSHSSHILEMTLEEPLTLNENKFLVTFTFRDQNKTAITLPFELQKPIAQVKEIKPNKTVQVDGQKFTITSIRRTPLRIAIDVVPDETNTMQLIAFNDLTVELKNGKKRELIKNGIVGSGNFREGKVTFYLQSNYFYDSDKLTVHIGEVLAVPKEDDFIEVDFMTKEITHIPDYIDWPMKVEHYSVYYSAPVKNNHGRQHFYPAEKEDGSQLYSTSSSFHIVVDDMNPFNYTENFEPYNGKVKLYVNYFDQPIAKDITLQFDL